MNKISKRTKKNKEGIDSSKIYNILEGAKLVKDRGNVKFNETLDISVNLEIDPKQSDQIVRGTVNLPHGTGRKIKIAVFAKDEKAEEAKLAGADYIGSEDLVSKVEGGFLDFERVVATPDLMPLVGKVAKILGPKGLMPNPKIGTVTNEIDKCVKDIKAGQVEFKTEKAGIVHAGIGKVSFSVEQLEANIKAFIDAVKKSKPSGVKGNYIKNIFISSTMGPSLKIKYN